MSISSSVLSLKFVRFHFNTIDNTCLFYISVDPLPPKPKISFFPGILYYASLATSDKVALNVVVV